MLELVRDGFSFGFEHFYRNSFDSSYDFRTLLVQYRSDGLNLYAQNKEIYQNNLKQILDSYE